MARTSPSTSTPPAAWRGRSHAGLARLSPASYLLALALVGLLVFPLVALVVSTSPSSLRAGLQHPSFGPALALSLRTTLTSLALTLALGTPLSWWLASSSSRLARVLSVCVELPIVIPPAVIGVALLQAFGREGLLGGPLSSLGVSLPFTESAVVLAQLVVSAPFYVRAATAGFSQLDPDMVLVARTLGASPRAAFFRVALPATLPALLAGASLCWARALGEFGATLLFAGNLGGRTQTMPLAIFSALESDVQLAVSFSVVLAGVSALLLLLLRDAPRQFRRARSGS